MDRRLVLLVGAFLATCGSVGASQFCPLPTPPNGNSIITYSPACWVRFEIDVQPKWSEDVDDNGMGRGKLNCEANGFTARLYGAVFDSQVGSAISVTVDATGFVSEEWHVTSVPGSGVVGGHIELEMRGKGRGAVNLRGEFSSGHGFLQLDFESNILTMPITRSVSAAATTGVSGAISFTVPGPGGTSIPVSFPSVSGLGSHAATPFDLGVKRAEGCDDEWTYNQTAIAIGKLDANGNILILRTGMANSCFTAYFTMEATLGCLCP